MNTITEELNRKLKLVGDNAEQREAVLLEWVNNHIKVNGKRIKAEPNDPGKDGWKF